MTWRARLKEPASFRGVPFWVASSERGGGRRTVTHEYPLRDDPYLEDMGRAARTYPVEGYVVGEDYIAARDALIAALEEAGPGELRHPYHGTLRVVCPEFSVHESSDEGGMARFGITFAETESAPRAPTAVANPAALARASASRARVAARAEFLESYRTTSLMNSAADMLRSATLRINQVRSTIGRSAQEVATMQRRVDELLASAAALVRTPGNLFAQLAAMFGGLGGGEAIRAYSFDAGVRPPATTAARRAERRNFDALQAVTQRLAVIRAAEEAPSDPYDSHDAAVAARIAITDRLDEQMETADLAAFDALQQLRADVAKAVPPPDRSLPHLASYEPPQTVPSLVLAHRLYGDISVEADLLARNKILHPGFILGGRGVEVRTRA